MFFVLRDTDGQMQVHLPWRRVLLTGCEAMLMASAFRALTGAA